MFSSVKRVGSKLTTVELLEDLATVADSIHPTAAVFLGFLFHRLWPTSGTAEFAAKVANEIHPGLVGQNEPFQDRSRVNEAQMDQRGRDSAGGGPSAPPKGGIPAATREDG